MIRTTTDSKFGILGYESLCEYLRDPDFQILQIEKLDSENFLVEIRCKKEGEDE